MTSNQTLRAMLRQWNSLEFNMKIRKIVGNGLFMGLSIVSMSCSVFGIRSEESPKYEVLQTEGNKEIRSYSSYIVAKTIVKGEFKEVQSEAFRILASYIFGNNERKQKLSMTAPVVQEKSIENEKISMTAPVVQSSTDEGWTMTFMMPSKYKLADLPTPKDSRVSLEEVPAKIFAVIRYSGLGSLKANTEKADELKTWLAANSKYDILGKPSFAGFDPPWTIPFLRRNEMMYELKSKE